MVKTRLEVIGFNEYSGIIDACKKIYRNEGPGGFFTGLKVSLIRDVPFSGTFYPIYSFFRAQLSSMLHLDTCSQSERAKRLMIVSTVSSFSANVVSCTITHPLDLIRTREICKFYNHDKSQHYSGILQGFRKILSTDGFVGLFSGLTPRILRKGLGSIIAWTFYEFLIDKKDAFIKIDA